MRRDLERLVDEYAQADGLDRRRRERLAGLIVETARRSGLGARGRRRRRGRCRRGAAPHRCLAVRSQGPRRQGRPPRLRPHARWHGADPLCRRPGGRAPTAERAALLAALDGRRVAPGPAGAPARGRRDVLPTGRNLYTADPRMLPTPTAMELGAARRRRGDPRPSAGPWRDAARARHRSLGQRDACAPAARRSPTASR